MIPSIAVSLDAEKVFDMVEWPHLFCVLKKFAFGTGLTGLLKALYRSPQARAISNKITSGSFQLYRENSQGDPVSPAFFALAIKPLAKAIRSSLNIWVFYIGNDTHEISLFADDIILFLTNPDHSLHHLQELLGVNSRGGNLAATHDSIRFRFLR